jgi:S1-C subfamily serine protease
MDELGNLYWFTGNKDKALELKIKVLKHYEFNKNKYQVKKIKNWILSIEPTYFDKKPITRGIKPKQSEEYEEEEIDNYEENKIVPHYEEFEFAEYGHGSGIIVGEGQYVITNNHVIDGAKKIAVRNGIGKVSNAKVYRVDKKYDLAILELEKPYSPEFAFGVKNFASPKTGEDVLVIGYPNVGETDDLPTITQGIISKIFDQKGYIHEGTFLTTAPVNKGNSGGPVFNINGKLVGIIYAGLDQFKWKEVFDSFPTAMGYGITIDKVKGIFEYQKGIPIKKVKYSKAAIYEKMLPSIVIVATPPKNQDE